MEGQWGLYSIVKHHGHIWGWVLFFFPCVVDGFKTNLLLIFLLKPLCWNFFLHKNNLNLRIFFVKHIHSYVFFQLPSKILKFPFRSYQNVVIFYTWNIFQAFPCFTLNQYASFCMWFAIFVRKAVRTPCLGFKVWGLGFGFQDCGVPNHFYSANLRKGQFCQRKIKPSSLICVISWWP